MLSSTHTDERKNLVVAGGAQREWARFTRSFRRHPFDLHRSSAGLSQALEECRKLAACVLIVDFDFLVNSHPPAELSKIPEFGRPVSVLVLVENESDEILEFLLCRGCMGVLQAGSTPARLRRAVNAVISGEIWAPRKLLSRVFQNIFFRRDPRNLTTREFEILALAARGLTNQQIAEALHIGRETVRWNMRMIYGKLGVHDRQSASALAFGTGLRKPVLPEIRLSKKLIESAQVAAKSSAHRRG
jgi:DNA-binding NarL/FixJ family response regulator